MMNGFCSNENLWGIDLGGTKIVGVLLESAQNPWVLIFSAPVVKPVLG